MSLQEWVENRSRELQTNEKRKATKKGQGTSAGSDPEVIEVTGQERGEPEAGEQATVRVAGEAKPAVEEEVEGEVPLVQKRRRLTKLGEMVPVREGTSGGEVVPTGEGGPPEEDGRRAVEGARVSGEPRAGEESGGSQVELLLRNVSAEQPSQVERPAQVGQQDCTRMLRALADVQATLCATPGSLGRIEGNRGETSATRGDW